MKPGTKIGTSALASVALLYISSWLGSSVGTARWNSEITNKRVDSSYGLTNYLTDNPDSLLNSNLFAWLVIFAILGGSAYAIWIYVKGFSTLRQDESNSEEPSAESQQTPSLKIPSWILVILAMVMFYSYSSAKTSAYQSLKDDSHQQALEQMTPSQYQATLKLMSPEVRQQSIDSLTPSQKERLLKPLQ